MRLMKERTINWHVALRKESVDRNIAAYVAMVPSEVALRKESVDRNHRFFHVRQCGRTVALRKESVDRNRLRRLCGVQLQQSLSARRAWIEIYTAIVFAPPIPSRSPQGERG